jgi:molybdopterin-binding protein
LVSDYRLKEAAQLLGVSDDTVRRWVAAGRLTARASGAGHQVVDGVELARFAQELAGAAEQLDVPGGERTSARNRFVGLVTRVVRDTVMTQVEMQAGPHRVVSLMSTEAADELGLEPGVLAAAVIKSTTVVVERLPR